MADSLRNMARFFGIERSRLAFADSAKAAMTRADVAAEHEGRGAVGPAFENVWAASFLTDGVQVQTFDQLQHPILIGRIAEPDAQPFGLWLTDLLIVADYTEFAGQLFTSGSDSTGFVFHRETRSAERTVGAALRGRPRLKSIL